MRILSMRGWVFAVIGVVAASPVLAQSLTEPIQLADRVPVFFSIAPSSGERVDARGATVLRRRIAVELRDIPLADALDSVSRVSRLAINYSRDLLPPDARVSLGAHDIPVEGALTVLLLDTHLDVELIGTQATLVHRGSPVAPPVACLPLQQGTAIITGHVTDGALKTPLSDASTLTMPLNDHPPPPSYD
jgi:hypothetical protein